jgi:hypothetical protein
VEPLGHGAIRFGHLGDLREQGALPFGPLLVLARSFIAARSSSVNPSDFLALIIPSRVRLSGSAVHALRILIDGGFSTPF